MLSIIPPSGERVIVRTGRLFLIRLYLHVTPWCIFYVDPPVLSVISPSGKSAIVSIGKAFSIRINVTQGDAIVNLTIVGNLVQLNSKGKLYEHNIRRVKASTNGTYVAIGVNDVGYHRVSFHLLSFCKHHAIADIGMY